MEEMKTRFAAVAAVALAALAAAPAFANSQLIANAGLTPAEAAGLSLTEIAVAKFNRNADNDDRQEIVVRDRRADPALTAAAIARFNRNADHDDRQMPVSRSGVTMTSRSMNVAAFSQLAANAGLTLEEARGMSLSEIAAAKFNRNADHDDRIGYALGG
jgi:hypothetical protein